MAKEKVVYTCITGSYDELFDHQYVSPEWDYICFSDTVVQSDQNSSWRILPLRYKELDNTRNNRWHKINAHKVVGDYRRSIYIDANLDIKGKVFFDRLKSVAARNIFSVMLHPERDCVYDEARVCIELKKDVPKNILPQLKTYRRDGYPEHNGLFANGILYREHNNPEVISIMEDWWFWVKKYSKRDQLSLPYVLWKHNFRPGILPYRYNDNSSEELFTWPHADDFRSHLMGVYDRLNKSNEEIQILQNELVKTQEELNKVKRSYIWRIGSRIKRGPYLNRRG